MDPVLDFVSGLDPTGLLLLAVVGIWIWRGVRDTSSLQSDADWNWAIWQRSLQDEEQMLARVFPGEDHARLLRLISRYGIEYRPGLGFVLHPAPEAVDDVIRQLFPDHELAAVRQVLEQYQEAGQFAASHRVHLDILRLSQGHFPALGELVERACNDFREVIGPAEMPKVSQLMSRRMDFSYPGAAQQLQALEAEDLRSYMHWLIEVLRPEQPLTPG